MNSINKLAEISVGLAAALGVIALVGWLIIRGISVWRGRNEIFEPEAVKQIRELHEWHDVKDQEGVRMWYERRTVINRIAETQERQTQILDQQSKTLALFYELLKDKIK